jgi:hypothetical protein
VKVEHTLQPFSWLIAGAILVLGIAYVARRWRRVRAEYAILDRPHEDAPGALDP